MDCSLTVPIIHIVAHTIDQLTQASSAVFFDFLTVPPDQDCLAFIERIFELAAAIEPSFVRRDPFNEERWRRLPNELFGPSRCRRAPWSRCHTSLAIVLTCWQIKKIRGKKGR